MEQIIDAENKEVTPLKDKSVTTLTAEANELYARAESVAAVSMMMLVETGKRLQIIKERVGHGGWEDWMKENLSFSGRKANRIMKLAEKADEEGGLFANPTTLSDIEISKVWALLEAPEEVAKEVVETTKIEDVSVRELKAELKKVKEENKALAAASEEEKRLYQRTAESVNALEAQLREAKRQKEQAEVKAAALPAVSELERKLKEERQRLRDYKTKVKEDQDKQKEKAREEAREEAKKELDGKVEELNEKIQKAEADARANAAGEVEDLKKEVDRLQKLSDPATGEFRAHVNSLQREFNECLGAIEKAAPENREKWRAALKKVVIEGMGGQL